MSGNTEKESSINSACDVHLHDILHFWYVHVDVIFIHSDLHPECQKGPHPAPTPCTEEDTRGFLDMACSQKY